MKVTLAWTTVAAALALAAIGAPSHAVVAAADINIRGATDTTATMTMKMPSAAAASNAMPSAAMPMDAKIKIATADILNKPTALINKNTLAMDNNVFVSRSNIVFSQSDRLALAKRVEQLVTSPAAADMSAAVLSKNVLRAVSRGDGDSDAAAAMISGAGRTMAGGGAMRAGAGAGSDAVLMTKASAVVAAKDDAAARGQRIADLVRAVFDAKQQQQQSEAATEATKIEQSIQTETPRGVIVLVGTKDILRQPTAVVNKNVAVSDTQVAVSRSNVAPSQNDNVALAGGAKVADAVLPASAVKVSADAIKSMGTRARKDDDDNSDDGKDNKGESDVSGAAEAQASPADNVRVGFLYSKSEAAGSHEQFWGLGGAGLGFGWRYPLGYWNLYGAGLYGGGCGLGLAYGPYFYC